MMTLNASGCRAVLVHPYDWTLVQRPRLAAARLIDRQPGCWESRVALADRVWLEMDGEESDLDAAAVRAAASEMLGG